MRVEFGKVVKAMMVGVGVGMLAIFLFGCGGTGTTQTQDALIGILAQDVGYGVYRGVPDARTPLATLCMIQDFTNPMLVASQLQEMLEKVWEDAKSITDTDVQVTALTVSNLMALLDTQTVLGDSATSADVARVKAILQLVVTNICKGATLAGGGGK